MRYLLAIGLLATVSSNASAVVIGEFGAPGVQENGDRVIHTDLGPQSFEPQVVVLPSQSAGAGATQAPAHTGNVIFVTGDGAPPAAVTVSPQSSPSITEQLVSPPPGFELPPPSNGKPPFLAELPIPDLVDLPGGPELIPEVPVRVSEPASLVLLGMGLLGLAILRRRTQAQ